MATDTEWTYELHRLECRIGGEGVADEDYFVDEGDEIGQALGMSRQAAHKRFSRHGATS
jgi:hypothetical protein